MTQTLLITGAGGTVGQLLVDYYLKNSTYTIKALERSEVAMAELLNRHRDADRVEPVFADLLDLVSFKGTLDDCDFVIHCAALKHVMIGKHFPGRHAYENVASFCNLLQEARRASVKKFLFCSTDKAAQPTSAMGGAKHLLEFICRDAATDDFATGSVRFANILGSSGSLLRVLDEAIHDGRDFILRDARMTRYFLRPHEATELIDFALNHLKHGEIFIRNTPTALIRDVVDVIFEHHDVSPERIKVASTPLHENIHERLISQDEAALTTKKGQYYMVGAADGEKLSNEEYASAFSSSVHNLSKAQIRKLLYGN